MSKKEKGEKQLTKKQKALLDTAAKKIVKEYGEVLKWLSKV